MRKLWLLLLCVFCLSVCALAQSSASGTVSGQVTDQQGAVIPGVEIKLTDPSTNITLTATTNEVGRFILTNVTPTTYNLTFSKTGFSAYRVNQQPVEVGDILTVNAVLEVGALTNVVEVSGSGVELQTVNATVGTTVVGDSLTYLPIFGSDASSLAIYQPGVSPDWLGRGSDVRPEHVPTGRRQQLERYGRQYGRLHGKLRPQRLCRSGQPSEWFASDAGRHD